MCRFYFVALTLPVFVFLTVFFSVSVSFADPSAPEMEVKMETEKTVLPENSSLPPVFGVEGDALEKEALPEAGALETVALETEIDEIVEDKIVALETEIDEIVTFPEYPPDARIALGKLQTYSVGEEDTLLDIARYFELGFVEIRAANPKVDPWTPVPGEEIVIPSFRLLPRVQQEGIVVNLAQMRMYYFEDHAKEPLTFPIGIGREGLQTPTGETTVVRKTVDPVWRPTERMRAEKPELPVVVPAGPTNPLGTHALYLGWPTFLIHGSNKPWAIGRRVSSGCMRMYPEGIIVLFDKVPVGTKVTVVDQPILVGKVGDNIYLEANPSKTQSSDIEIKGFHVIEGISDTLRKTIILAAGVSAEQINWDIAGKVVEERLGYPVIINRKPEIKKRKPKTRRFDYN